MAGILTDEELLKLGPTPVTQPAPTPALAPPPTPSVGILSDEELGRIGAPAPAAGLGELKERDEAALVHAHDERVNHLRQQSWYGPIMAKWKAAGIHPFAVEHSIIHESAGDPKRDQVGGAGRGLYQFDFAGGVGSQLVKRGHTPFEALAIAHDPIRATDAFLDIEKDAIARVARIKDPVKQAAEFTRQVERPALRYANQRAAAAARDFPHYGYGGSRGDERPTPAPGGPHSTGLLTNAELKQIPPQALPAAAPAPSRPRSERDRFFFDPTTWGTTNDGTTTPQQLGQTAREVLAPIGSHRLAELDQQVRRSVALDPLKKGRQLREIERIRPTFERYLADVIDPALQDFYQTASTTGQSGLGLSPELATQGLKTRQQAAEQLTAQLRKRLDPDRVIPVLKARGVRFTPLQAQAFRSALAAKAVQLANDPKVHQGFALDALIAAASQALGGVAAHAAAPVTARAGEALVGRLAPEAQAAVKYLATKPAGQAASRFFNPAAALGSGVAGEAQYQATERILGEKPQWGAGGAQALALHGISALLHEPIHQYAERQAPPAPVVPPDAAAHAGYSPGGYVEPSRPLPTLRPPTVQEFAPKRPLRPLRPLAEAVEAHPGQEAAPGTPARSSLRAQAEARMKERMQPAAPVEARPESAIVPQAPKPAESGAAGTGKAIVPEASAPKAHAPLPRELSGAKPRYSFGDKQFDLDFADDLDKAAYIAAQAKKSKRDADFVAHVVDQTGLSEAEVRRSGLTIRDTIKEQARQAEASGKLRVEPFLRPKLEGQAARKTSAAAPIPAPEPTPAVPSAAPVAEPAGASALAPAAKRPPNHVFRLVRNHDGDVLGVLSAPYDGTEEGARRAAIRLSAEAGERFQSTDRKQEGSHGQSLTATTDEHGNPKWAVSQNFLHVAPLASDEGRYIFGDLSAAPPEARAENARPAAPGTIREHPSAPVVPEKPTPSATIAPGSRVSWTNSGGMVSHGVVDRVEGEHAHVRALIGTPPQPAPHTMRIPVEKLTATEGAPAIKDSAPKVEQAAPKGPVVSPAVNKPAAQAVEPPTPKPAGNPAHAAGLRRVADGLSATIEAKRNPAIAQRNVTARRANIAGNMANEADRLERLQQRLHALADHAEAGTLPESLAGIKSRAALETLTYARKFEPPSAHAANVRSVYEATKGVRGLAEARRKVAGALMRGDGRLPFHGKDELAAIEAVTKAAALKGESSARWVTEGLAEGKRLAAAGIDTPEKFAQAKADLERMGKSAPTEKTPEQRIKEAERALIGRKIDGYFPTPTPVVERMLAEADLRPGQRVLEPSAGKGNIADALREAGAKPETIEPVQDLRAILEAKGHPVVGRDFLEQRGEYDRIVMNPPFENGQDMAHVRHAYDLLKPGGRVVSIMSEGPFFRSDKRSAEFRAWLDEHGGTSEKLPEGAFQSSERPTGVNTRLVVIEKPAAPKAESVAKPAPHQWKYEEYSDWSRQLAKNYSRAELESRLRKLGGELERSTAAHLRAIERTSSMQSQSQARAQTGNVVRANGEERMALQNALEIYDNYPERTKEGAAPPQVKTEPAAGTVPQIDPEIARLKAKIAALEPVANAPTETPGAFVTGRSNRSASLGKRLDAENNRRANAYRELTEAKARLAELGTRREGVLAGEVHPNGQPRADAPSRERRAAADDTYAEYLKTRLRPGGRAALRDNPDSIVSIQRVNAKSVTTIGGTSWKYAELLPVDERGKSLSTDELRADLKRWRDEQQATPAPLVRPALQDATEAALGESSGDDRRKAEKPTVTTTPAPASKEANVRTAAPAEPTSRRGRGNEPLGTAGDAGAALPGSDAGRRAASAGEPTFLVTGKGGIKLRGKRPLTSADTSDVVTLYHADPAEKSRIHAEWGSDRYIRAADNMGRLEEAGVLDEAIEAHGRHHEEAYQAAELKAIERETSKAQRESVQEAISQGRRVERSYVDDRGRSRSAKYVELSDSLSRRQLEDLYETVRSEGNDSREWHIPGHGTSSLHDLVVDARIVPQDVAQWWLRGESKPKATKTEVPAEQQPADRAHFEAQGFEPLSPPVKPSADTGPRARREIEQRLKDGNPVATDALAQYPDLQEKYGKAASSLEPASTLAQDVRNTVTALRGQATTEAVTQKLAAQGHKIGEATAEVNRQLDTGELRRDGKLLATGAKPKGVAEELTLKSDDPNFGQSGMSFDRPMNAPPSANRIPPAPLPGGAPKKLSEIVLDFEKALGKRIVPGKPSPRALGTYYPGSAKTVVRFAGDLDTTAHEVAHFLDDQYHLGDLAGQALAPFDHELLSPAFQATAKPRMPLAAKRAEGVAEFIRAFIVNPQAAQHAAPQFHAYLAQKVPKEALAALQGFSHDVRTWAGASGVEQTLSNVRTEIRQPGLGATVREAVRGSGRTPFETTTVDRLKAKTLDDLLPIIRGIERARELRGANVPGAHSLLGQPGAIHVVPELDPINAIRTHAGNLDKVGDIIERGPVNARNERVKGLEGGFKKLLEPFDDTSEATLQRDMGDTVAYMISQRTLHEAAQRKNPAAARISGAGGGLFSDLSVAQKTLAELRVDPARLKRIEEGAKRYREWSNWLLDYMVEKGRMGKAEVARIRAENPFYVDMHRVLEDAGLPVPRPAGKRLGSTAKVIQRFKGGTPTIDNPYVNLMAQTYAAVKEADRNEPLRMFRDLLTDTRGLHQGDVKDLASIGYRVPSTEKGEKITVYVDGKPEHWKFEKGIYESLKGWGEIGRSDILTQVAGFMRAAITHSPGFAVRNAIRDTVERSLVSNVGSTPLDVWRGFAKQDLDRYRLAGGGQAGHYLKDRVSYHQELSRQVAALAKDKHSLVVMGRDAVTALKDAGERSELLNRLAEFGAAKKYAKEQLGYDDYNAEKFAAAEARGLMDFAVAGSTVRQLNRYVPFTNAHIQGLRRGIQAIQSNPKAFMLRWSIYVGVPTLINYLWNASQGEKTKNEYLQQPAYLRDMFWNYKVAPDTWLRIPKPFDFGVLASGVERGLDRAAGDEHAFEGYGGSLAKALLPMDETALAGPLRPVVETIANKDLFRGRSIVPPWEEGKALPLRRGTERASRIGKALQSALNVDARKIDYLIHNTAGGAGQAATQLSDVGREDRPVTATDALNTATGLFVHSPVYTSRDVQFVLSQAKMRGQEQSQPVQQLQDLLRRYYAAENDDERAERAERVREYARRLRPRFERPIPTPRH